jgi:ParB-like nuclease domain
MIKCFFVDVANISSETPRSNFDESDLEQLADLILQTDGLLRPLILNQTGTEKYTVVEGHREYYAVVKAKEKDCKKAEMVNAFVVPNQIYVSATNQLKLLKADRSSISSSATNLVNVEQLLPTLLAALSQQIQPIVNQLAEHKQILDVLQTNSTSINSTIPELATKQEPISIPQPESNPVVVIVPPPLATTAKIEPVKIPETKSDPLTLINTLSQAELSICMERSRISKAITKLIPNLIATRNMQPDQKFPTWETIIVAKISGLGDKRIKEIIEKLK